MNLEELARNVGYHMRIEPPAYQLDEHGREIYTPRFEWVVDEVTRRSIQLSSFEAGLAVPLLPDHVFSYTASPDLPDGIKRGFLTLRVQVVLQGARVELRPCGRPGERVEPVPAGVREEFIDFGYPKDSGLQGRLEAGGWKISWCLISRLRRRIDIEGWELVIDRDVHGAPVSYRIRDRIEDSVLIKMRRGDDFDDIVDARRQQMAGIQGYVDTQIHSRDPRVLAHTFDGPGTAQLFVLQRGTGANRPRYTSAAGRVDLVLEDLSV